MLRLERDLNNGRFVHRVSERQPYGDGYALAQRRKSGGMLQPDRIAIQPKSTISAFPHPAGVAGAGGNGIRNTALRFQSHVGTSI